MAVMARETWTDERLDDLNARVEKGFDEVKGEIRDLRSETKAEFKATRSETKAEFKAVQDQTKAEFRELRKEMNFRFDGVNARFDSLQKTLVLGIVSMSGSVISALIVTQL